MDKPADPATPFCEVYQSFLDDLKMHGTKPATIDCYRYNIARFEAWLAKTERPTTLASLEQSILFACRQHLGMGPRPASEGKAHSAFMVGMQVDQ